MISRKAKAAFYAAAGPLMAVNGRIYRWIRSPASGDVKVQLGPGQRNYLDGWVNVDANMFTGRCDVWADLRNALPFHDGSVRAFYSHHVIEHLPDLRFHMQDVFRCLKPGGVYRVGGPNGDSAVRMFLERRSDWFGDFPERRRSPGGRLENFIFCKGEHLTILTESFLRELLEDAGFIDIHACVPTRETRHEQLFAECLPKEFESDFEVPHTLIVEAVKPGTAVSR